MIRRPPRSPLFPSPTLFRSHPPRDPPPPPREADVGRRSRRGVRDDERLALASLQHPQARRPRALRTSRTVPPLFAQHQRLRRRNEHADRILHARSQERETIMNAGAALIILAAFALSLAIYPLLPARIPIHWNLAGNVDGFALKLWGAFLMPCTISATAS